MTKLEVPEHAGSRDQAKELLARLPGDLSGRTIVLDCSRLAVSTPSFLDEVVKILLLDRRAKRLDLIEANERTELHVQRSAQNRGVAQRVTVALRV